MSKDIIDLKKLLETRGATDKFVDKLNKAYVESVTDEIEFTINKFEGSSNSDTLRELKKDPGDDWLRALVYSVIYASKGVSALGIRLAQTSIDETRMGEFIGDFEDKIRVKVTNNIKYKKGLPGAFEIMLTLKGEEGDSKAEDISRALAVMIHGGEFTPGKSYIEDEDADNIIINASPGFYENKINAGAEKLRQYFVDNFEKNLEKSLKDELKDELKKLELELKKP